MYIHEVLGAWHVIPPRVQVLREEELIAGGQDEELGHGEPLPVPWSQGHTPTQQSLTCRLLIRYTRFASGIHERFHEKNRQKAITKHSQPLFDLVLTLDAPMTINLVMFAPGTFVLPAPEWCPCHAYAPGRRHTH